MQNHQSAPPHRTHSFNGWIRRHQQMGCVFLISRLLTTLKLINVSRVHSARAHASGGPRRDAKVTLHCTICNRTSSVVVGVPGLDVRLARRLVGDLDFVPCGAARAGCRERVCQRARGRVSMLKYALDPIDTGWTFEICGCVWPALYTPLTMTL